MLFFLLLMIAFVTLGGMIQARFDLAGVAVTEAGFLAASLLFVKLAGADFREVFPLKKPKAGAVLGVLVIFAGEYLACDVISIILLYIAPDSVMEISQGMQQTFYGLPAAVAFLIIAVMPAVCEEALHRGVIQNGLKNDLRQNRLVILFTGVIFGIFHLYPVRFLPTAFIGLILAGLLVSTGNMFYNCFLHFVHNGVIFLISAFAGMHYDSFYESVGELGTSLFSNISVLGIALAVYAAPVPILLYSGFYLVRRATAPVRPKFLPAGRENETLWLILLPTIALPAIGICIMLLSVL